MTLLTCLQELQGIIPPSERSICASLARFISTVAYSAPELHDGLWHRVFEELILTEVAPRDTEPWGERACDCWHAHVPGGRTKKEP